MKKQHLIGHLFTLFTITVWSTTFISSKLLLNEFTPVEIIFYRFIIGYIALWIIYPKKPHKTNLKEELLFLGLGFFGITFYFLCENYALKYTTVSNVGLLVAFAPILTLVLAHFTTKQKTLNRTTLMGFLLAILGVFLVMFNGRYIPEINPLGDGLALVAALAWAFYSNILQNLSGKYTTLAITRKTFFYGILTVLPFILFTGEDLQPIHNITPTILLNFLFLSVIASALCYVLWGLGMKYIGIVKTSNYIYLMPLLTMICSFLFLHEVINTLMAIGGLLIIAGVYVSEKTSKSSSN